MNIKQTSNGKLSLAQHLNFAWPSSMSSWLFAISMVLSPLNDLSVAEHISFGDVFFAAAVLVALFERLRSGETIPVMRFYLFVMAGLLLCYFVDHAGRPEDELASFFVIFTMLALFFQGILVLRIGNQAEMKFMIYAWAIGGMISSLFVIGYCNGLFGWHADPYWYWDHRARGLTPNPNRLGLNCYMTLPGILLFISSSRTLVGKLIGIALIGISLKALNYSGSRAGMVAALILLAAWGAMQVWEHAKGGRVHRQKSAGLVVWFGLLTAAFAGYGISIGQVPFLQSTLDRLTSGDNVSDGARAFVNERSWEGFFANPIFGEGFKYFGVFQPNVAHNIYLQYLNAVGLVGFSIFIAVVLYPLIYPVKKQFSQDNSAYTVLNTPLLAAAFALLVWLKPQSGFTNYEGLLVFGLLAYISVWRLYDRP